MNYHALVWVVLVKSSCIISGVCVCVCVRASVWRVKYLAAEEVCVGLRLWGNGGRGGMGDGDPPLSVKWTVSLGSIWLMVSGHENQGTESLTPLKALSTPAGISLKGWPVQVQWEECNLSDWGTWRFAPTVTTLTCTVVDSCEIARAANNRKFRWTSVSIFQTVNLIGTL